MHLTTVLMKVVLPLILFLLQLLFAFSLNAQSITKYTSADLNLRTEPNSSSTALAVIPAGTPVTLSEDCNCDWISVEYNGHIGYVNSKYLKTASEYTATQHSGTAIKYYTNSAGERVQSPTYYNSTPKNATALCRDGTYSFSRNKKGTCSHHGGVARWL